MTSLAPFGAISVVTTAGVRRSGYHQQSMVRRRSLSFGSRSGLMPLFRAIASGDTNRTFRLLKAWPALAREPIRTGAGRDNPAPYYLKKINHYVYAGDTALHIAAAAYRRGVAEELVARGADVRARNRRGAEPLHDGADGMPDSDHWHPRNQTATIAYLIRAGADPNACDASGVTPLHRAVRTRCAAAVRALLEGGADPRRTNGSGSTPLNLSSETPAGARAGCLQHVHSRSGSSSCSKRGSITLDMASIASLSDTGSRHESDAGEECHK
jgi:ankyrin repeat protein